MDVIDQWLTAKLKKLEAWIASDPVADREAEWKALRKLAASEDAKYRAWRKARPGNRRKAHDRYREAATAKSRLAYAQSPRDFERDVVRVQNEIAAINATLYGTPTDEEREMIAEMGRTQAEHLHSNIEMRRLEIEMGRMFGARPDNRVSRAERQYKRFREALKEKLNQLA